MKAEGFFLSLLLICIIPFSNPITFEQSKPYFGTWLDGGFSKDHPIMFNYRMNMTTAVFQFGQAFPTVRRFANADVDETETDAIVLLAIYPNQINTLLDDDVMQLVEQCDILNKKGRRVILRLAPGKYIYIFNCFIILSKRDEW